MAIELVMPSNHLILCHLLLFLPSMFPSIRVFFNESVLRIRWPKYWSFSFIISPSTEYSGSISFRIDCFDLLAVQVTLKSLLQHHSLKASIFWCSAIFYCPDLISTHDYWKNHSFDYMDFVGKVISLLFNMLWKFITAFLPISKHLLISWPQSQSKVILEPKKLKSITVSIISPLICHEVMRLDAMIFVFWMLSFKPAFSLSIFTFIKRLFNSSSLSPIRLLVIYMSEGIDVSPGNLDSISCFIQPRILHDVTLYIR